MWFPRVGRPSSAALALLALAAVWMIFVAAYVFLPRPPAGWATAQPDLQQAIATFDKLDYAKARRQFTVLANGKNAAAEMWLGYMDEHGFGGKRDPATARADYATAAAEGSATAARRLGEMYLRGDGILQDVTTAQQWLKRAAAGGDAVAERKVGEIYAQGLGVPKDEAQAYVWLDIAASHGDMLAARERNAVLAQLAPAEVAHAELLAQQTLQALSRTAEVTNRSAA